MKKLLTLFISIMLVLFCCSCSLSSQSSPQSEEISSEDSSMKGVLTLRQTTWITCTNNAFGAKNFVDFSASGESEDTQVFAKSQNEDIVWIKDGNDITVGQKFGKAIVEIYTDDKVGYLEVEVVPYLRYLEEEAKENRNEEIFHYKQSYLACKWLIDNINSFKDPNSVEVLDWWYHESSSGNVDFVMMEIRAKNSFGGYTIDYVMVKSYGIFEGYCPEISYSTLMDGFYDLGSTYKIEKVLSEYKQGIR